MHGCTQPVTSSCFLTATQESGDIETAELLLEAGADMNDVDCVGRTALVLAAILADVEFVKLLLGEGVHISKLNTDGDGAVTYYLENHLWDEDILKVKDDEIVKILYVAGETVRNYLTAVHPIEDTNNKICLKQMCRKTIRHRLLELNLHLHLFDRIPLLHLPSSLESFLLYEMSLEQ